MSERPEWFAPHLYGMGTGWPIAWQGYALSVAPIVAVLFSRWLFGEDDPRPGPASRQLSRCRMPITWPGNRAWKYASAL